MNRLLKTQLKKAYGKEFDIQSVPDELRDLLELVNQAYNDFYIERQMLEHTLETNSKELTDSIRETLSSHELLKSVTDSMDSIIFYKDLELNYIGCNWHFTNLVNKPLEHIIGKNDYDLFDAEKAEYFQSDDLSVIKNGSPQALKEWVNNKDGNKLYFSTVKSPLRNEKGQIIGVVGVARDITKEYEMGQELEAKQLLLIQQGRQASMGEMIGNIAHQWRQPLNALGLIIQKIGIYQKKGVLDEEKVSTSIDKSLALINEMSATINDFREFFNPNKAKEHFSVRDAIEKAYTVVESALINHDIEFTHEIADDIKIEGYKNEFSQVIVNLLNNAKDVVVEKGIDPAYIKITAKQDEEALRVHVYDNGGGVPDTVIERIFEPYFSTKDEGKGTGIGLYMSKMIIEDHMKGRLSVSNTDDGACFTITI